MGFCVWSLALVLFCSSLSPSSFAKILMRKRELVVLLLLSFGCFVTVNILWLFLTVPWVSLQLVTVVFPDHTHLLFDSRIEPKFSELYSDRSACTKFNYNINFNVFFDVLSIILI